MKELRVENLVYPFQEKLVNGEDFKTEIYIIQPVVQDLCERGQLIIVNFAFLFLRNLQFFL